MIKDVLKKNIKTIAVAAALLLVYFATFFSIFFYNKSWNLNGSVENFEPIAIKKGQYEISIDYSSDDQVYLEGYITTKDQQFVIDGFLLEPSDSSQIAKLPMKIPYDINNKELAFRMTTISGGSASINSIGLKYAGGKLRELLALAVLVIIFAVTIASVAETKGEESSCIAGLTCKEHEKIFVSLLIGISFIVLHESFVKNPVFMLAYLLLICAYAFGKIKHSKDVQIFILFYMILMCVMCFFSPLSPLFTREMGRDTSVFYSVAQGIADGKVLYRDIFDHKGPVIYFIYVFAYWICKGGTIGVYFLEVIFLTMAVYYTFKIACRFMNEKAAYVTAFASFIVFFDSIYTCTGGECEQWFMGLLMMAIYYLIADDNRTIVYFVQGLAFTIVFYTKFNVAVGFVALIVFTGLRLLVRKQFKDFFKAVGAYVGAFALVTVLVLIYFGINRAIGSFYETYVVFNLSYSTESGSVVARVLSRLYKFYMSDKLTLILTALGMALFLTAKRFTDVIGKIGIVAGFSAMSFAVLPGHTVFEYYYCIVATYAVLGIIGIMAYISEHFKEFFVSGKSCIFACTFFVLATFLVNDKILQSDLISSEPKMQDIVVHEMRLRSRADASFIEWDAVEMGVYPAADIAPQFKYYFYPNINADKYPEPLSEMCRYMTEGLPEYIVAERYSRDAYLEGDIMAKYAFVNMYELMDDTGRVYMIYQRQ